MKLVTPLEAIRAIPDGSTVIFPHGCVEPTTLYTAFQHEVERFHHLTLYSGLAFGDYPFFCAQAWGPTSATSLGKRRRASATCFKRRRSALSQYA